MSSSPRRARADKKTAAPAPAQGFRHWEPLRVRWSECDPQGIVFNGQFMNYLDLAHTGYWRALGLPLPDGLRSLQADLVMRAAELDYLAPARYDEQLRCGLRLARVGSTSLRFEAELQRAGQCLMRARLTYVLVRRSAEGALRALETLPVPEALHGALSAFEGGEAMVSVQVGRWEQLGVHAEPIRQAVFVQEQGIAADLEWDGADPLCTHAVAFNRLGQALGTGRLTEHVPGTAKIGRMAVRPGARGTRVGALVLEALMDAARAQGFRQVLLHSQASAIGFYRRAGFVPRGVPFEEAGIEHQEMLRTL